MSMLLILILIPLLCITLSLFIMSLINYVTINELDVLMISTTLFLILVLCFVTIRLLIKNGKNTSVLLLNIDRNFLSIFGFLSFTIVAFLGICLLINSLLFKINIFNLVIGIVIIIFYTWLFINYILRKKTKVFSITMIDKVNNYIDLICLSDDDHEYEIYVKHNKKYIEDASYLCAYNPMSKEIRRIIKSVESGEFNEQ